MPNFKQMPMEPTQIVMFAVSVDESIPPDADVRMLSEAMDSLDWSELESSYSETGCPPYPPVVLAKVLVYGLSRGVRSSRKLEDMVANHKCYIYLAGGLTPDHSTISRFRKDRQEYLRQAYLATVRLCGEAGLVLLNVTATDGSKVPARASKKSLYDEKRIVRQMEAIDRALAEIDDVDSQEDELLGDAPVGKIPKELLDVKKRKAKLEDVAKNLKDSGCSRISATDKECRVMKTTGGLKPAYNVQITVDSAYGVIVAADVTDAQTDIGQLEGQLKQVEENIGLKADLALADTGYSDAATYKYLEASKQDALIPPREQPQERKRTDQFASKCFVMDEQKDVMTCPAGRELTFRRIVKNHCGDYRVYTAENCRDCPFYNECVSCQKKTGRSVQVSVVAKIREAMKERLKTPEGKQLYGLRKQTVERDLANIKSNMGLDRFLMDGKDGAKSETWLGCITHNLMIYVRQVLSPATRVAFS
jgi:transposase